MLLDELPSLPASPGVYIFRKNGTAIYIGKAASLRNRVVSHFRSEGKSERITTEADFLEFISTKNEVEALVLESNLIKQHRPHYNVLLKDDKHYPFLKLTNEKYPMLIVTRKVIKDGGTYFGPYPDSRAVSFVKSLIDTNFPLRKNSGLPFKTRKRACLNYHLGRCLAPCVGFVDQETYIKAVDDVKSILSGKTEAVLADLRQKMKSAAERQEFEIAQQMRDRINALEKLSNTEQVALSVNFEDMDFLGVAQAGEYAMVQLFRMRRGQVVGRDKRFFEALEASEQEILRAFMSNYYNLATQIPPVVLLPVELEDEETWIEFLSQKAHRTSQSKKVQIQTPIKRGDKLGLIEMAARNAKIGLESEMALLEKRGENPALDALAKAVALPTRPWRIEGFDNSNLFGSNIVSGMVVFEGGRSKRSEYRRFKVHGLDHPDDYKAMNQTITRRFSGRLSDSLPLPDLILIDGGHGQVSAAVSALKELELHIPLVGLAKREETIILPSRYGAQWWLAEMGTEIGHNRQLLLPQTHPALRVLIAVRDEVHRTAIGYHRKLREKGTMTSIFDEVPGIGPKRRETLLENFSSLEEIEAASIEDLARIPTIGLYAAQKVKEFFDKRKQQS